MSDRVADMTKEELQILIEESIEKKLLEIIGDPDEGLALREEVKKRLLDQKRRISEGERGLSYDEVDKYLNK